MKQKPTAQKFFLFLLVAQSRKTLQTYNLQHYNFLTLQSRKKEGLGGGSLEGGDKKLQPVIFWQITKASEQYMLACFLKHSMKSTIR